MNYIRNEESNVIESPAKKKIFELISIEFLNMIFMKTVIQTPIFYSGIMGLVERAILLIFLVLFFSSYSEGQTTYLSGFDHVQVANGISNPTAFAFAPDGRIFVTEQTGKLRIIKNGLLLSTEAIQLNVSSSGERGLLGIAFDPAFSSNNYIYLYHTVTGSIHNRITRYTMNGDLAADPQLVLDLDPLSTATNHNGGAMAFGPDGKLYVGVGENADGPKAQDLDTYHGKLLRINSDGSVPAGNPFTTGSAQRQRIWAYGLRNPYTFTFQPGTGKLFVNDVGQGSWEEINNATTGGLNFGWPSAEGTSTNPAYTNPVFAYGHGEGDGLGCAITGGTFFNPTATDYPAAAIGKYFYIELCEKWINYIDPTLGTPTGNPFALDIPGSAVEIKTGPDGNLYFLSRTNGALYKIMYGTTTALTEPQQGSALAVYPQPTSDMLYVEVNKGFTNYTINLTDMLGNSIVAPITVEEGKIGINVSSLSTGMYGLRLANSNKVITEQISVIR